MKITKIRMNTSKETSNHCIDIKELYIPDCSRPGWYSKASVYDAIKKGVKIHVDRYTYPECVAAESASGEKYVRSEPDDRETSPAIPHSTRFESYL